MAAAAPDGDWPAIYQLDKERLVIGKYDFGVASADQAPLALFDPSRGTIALDEDRITRTLAGKRRRTIRHETVRFGTIEGRLTLPSGRGPHPVLVMIPGAGRASRDFAYYGLFAAHLADRGLGVLTTDKRADWRNASVRELADDVVAAVDFLQTRKDVDRKRIGLYGHSQGGWIAPLVASQRTIAFICVVAAPAVSTAEQELDEAASDLRRRGFGDAEITEAHAALREMFRVVATGEGAEELAALVARVREKPWGRLIDLTANPQDLAHLKRSAYDPRPAIESLRVPVLALFGEADLIVPPARNVPLWKEYARRTSLEIQTFPGADHGLYVGNATALKQYAPGVVKRITDWLLAAAKK